MLRAVQHATLCVFAHRRFLHRDEIHSSVHLPQDCKEDAGGSRYSMACNTTRVLAKLLRRHCDVQVPLQRVLVVFDDMDVPNGTVRLRAKGGHGGHNGMRSITQHFSGSKEFPRLRLGMWPAFGQRIALDWSRWKAAPPVISRERQSDV